MESASPRRRPRFSLLSALLLMTIAGMGIVVWQLSREVLPLREEVRQLRQELGRLSIDDPAKIYAIKVPTPDRDTWRWRVYLPPGMAYSQHTRIHKIPGHKLGVDRQAWFKQLLESRSGESSEAPTGEFTIEVSLRSDPAKPGEWTLSHRAGTAQGGVGSEMKWLDDRRTWSVSSEAGGDVQIEKDASEGLELFTLRQGKLTETGGGGYTVTSPSGDEETPGVMFWFAPKR